MLEPLAQFLNFEFGIGLPLTAVERILTDAQGLSD